MTRTRLLCFALAAGLATGSGTSAQQGQVPGAFRSRITLVPLDIRVVDRHGTPVTDLKQEDFTVLEDGAPQEIGHFSFQALAPDPTGVGGGLELRRAPTDALTSNKRRVFLIVLGRGRLQSATRGLDAALAFVRENLLPQDLVAVQAYNRATGFTTDHSKAAAVLERFRGAHEAIENKLRNRAANVAGSRPGHLPRAIQASIDAIFDAPGAGARTLTPGTLSNDGRVVDTMRDASDRYLQQNLDSTNATDPAIETRTEEVLNNERAFDAFMAGATQAMTDLGTLFTAIEYLRFIDGEKRLIFISENGLLLPSLDDDKGLAALAADARVAIDTVRTGGIQELPIETVAAPAVAPNQRMLRSAGDVARSETQVRGSRAETVFTARSMKTFAELTGGVASLYEQPGYAFDQLDAATRSSYLIGYYPANGTWDGRFRRVQVRVNRRDVEVQHRFGYYARAQLVPFNRREFMTYARIASASNDTRPVRDIAVTVTASVVQAPGEDMQLSVEGTIDISKVAVLDQEGRRAISLDVAIFCGDGSEALVGERWQKLELKLTPENYALALKSGFAYASRVPIKARPKYVKVVVYDHAADLVGSASIAFDKR